jgi:hypothetical protein
VCGVEAIFPSQLALLVEKFFQNYQWETDDMIRRIQQLVEVQQNQEHLVDKAYAHQLKIKQAFDKKVKKEDFQAILCSSGMHRGKIKEITVNLKLYGLVLSKSLRYSLITLSS